MRRRALQDTLSLQDQARGKNALRTVTGLPREHFRLAENWFWTRPKSANILSLTWLNNDNCRRSRARPALKAEHKSNLEADCGVYRRNGAVVLLDQHQSGQPTPAKVIRSQASPYFAQSPTIKLILSSVEQQQNLSSSGLPRQSWITTWRLEIRRVVKTPQILLPQ